MCFRKKNEMDDKYWKEIERIFKRECLSLIIRTNGFDTRVLLLNGFQIRFCKKYIENWSQTKLDMEKWGVVGYNEYNQMDYLRIIENKTKEIVFDYIERLDDFEEPYIYGDSGGW